MTQKIFTILQFQREAAEREVSFKKNFKLGLNCIELQKLNSFTETIYEFTLTLMN